MTNIETQQILINHGLLDPPADGLWGAQCRAALEDFQSMHQLPVTGQLDDATYSLLKEAPVSQINLGADIASKIISFMLKQNYFISRGPNRYNIVYLEGANADGTLNNDAFNEWNDVRFVIEIPENTPKIVGKWLATTEPGATYTFNPMNPGGAFRIAVGQYRAWRFGRHGRTQYPALVQCGEISGYRDKNQDGKRTGDPFVTGDNFGVNQHHGWDMQFIDNASAGCLVGKSIEGHQDFMEILRGDSPKGIPSDRRYQLTSSPA
ncbi:MAG TPA: peptidoglycan-binding protein [Cyanobacteria bacterium UBA8553]|nr:peptidoglycan-binding protein [Cyanobacteria bacterium UBA8553]